MTRYRDHSAGPGQTVSYKLVANTSPSNEQTVILPGDGLSTKVLQPDGTAGQATGIGSGVGCANYGRSVAMWLAAGPTNTNRALVRFDLGSVPSGSSVEQATFSLYHEWGFPLAGTANVHQVTRS